MSNTVEKVYEERATTINKGLADMEDLAEKYYNSDSLDEEAATDLTRFITLSKRVVTVAENMALKGYYHDAISMLGQTAVAGQIYYDLMGEFPIWGRDEITEFLKCYEEFASNLAEEVIKAPNVGQLGTCIPVDVVVIRL